jgi:hypothetical protein
LSRRFFLSRFRGRKLASNIRKSGGELNFGGYGLRSLWARFRRMVGRDDKDGEQSWQDDESTKQSRERYISFRGSTIHDRS